MPRRFTVDDSMIIPASPKDPKMKLYRGPNIGEPPENTELPESIRGVAVIKVGDKITTDHIMPAGDKLKYRSNIPRYADFVFEPVDPKFSRRALDNKARGTVNIIIAGLSYGQGSSREHAALCPMYLGVRVVAAKSFERIHTANLVNAGIIPLTFQNNDDYTVILQDHELEFPLIRRELSRHEAVTLFDKTLSKPMKLDPAFTEGQIKLLLAGGTLNFIKQSNSK